MYCKLPVIRPQLNWLARILLDESCLLTLDTAIAKSFTRAEHCFLVTYSCFLLLSNRFASALIRSFSSLSTVSNDRTEDWESVIEVWGLAVILLDFVEIPLRFRSCRTSCIPRRVEWKGLTNDNRSNGLSEKAVSIESISSQKNPGKQFLNV